MNDEMLVCVERRNILKWNFSHTETENEFWYECNELVICVLRTEYVH